MTSSIPTNTPAVPFKRPPPRVVEVRRVTRLTPRMIRITFGGEQMAGFESKGPAEHIRVYMPDSETGELPLPRHGAGRQRLSGGQAATRQPRLHPAPVGLGDKGAGHRYRVPRRGPRPGMAAGVKEGDIAVISGRPGGTYFPNLDADWYLIAETRLRCLPTGSLVLKGLPVLFSRESIADLSCVDDPWEIRTAHRSTLREASTDELLEFFDFTSVQSVLEYKHGMTLIQNLALCRELREVICEKVLPVIQRLGH